MTQPPTPPTDTATQHSTVPPASFADAIAKVARSVVRVSSQPGPRRGGSSSGFFVADGQVVASARSLGVKPGHVGDLLVALEDCRVSATLTGLDFASDVALLTLNEPLGQLQEQPPAPPLLLREHDTLRVGEPVVAVARPGAVIRASSRIIGALGKAMQLSDGLTLDRYIETDRNLPRGFGGGPLIDAQGQVVGMNSRAVLRGVDLCLPSSTLLRVVDALAAHGQVQRGFLGVRVHTVRLSETVDGQRRGALVMDLAPDGPAAKGGLLLGDTIISLNGEAVPGPRALRARLFPLPQQQISLEVVRAGQRTELNVQTGVQMGAQP